MINKFKQIKYFCGLDLGTDTIKAALVCVRDQNNLDLLAVLEAPAVGMKDTSINDIGELSQSIRRLIADITQKTGVKIHAVTLGLSSDLVTSRPSQAVIPLIDAGTKVISRYDIKRVIDQTRLLGTALEEEVIHDIPQLFTIDDVNQSQNPSGMMGRKLHAKVLLILANVLRLRNLTKAVHQAGYEVDHLALSSYAAADVVLNDELKTGGCALVDIGSHMTTVMFFVRNHMVDIQFIPWGGAHVTQGLSGRLHVTLDMAEEIKKTHAVASQTESGGSSGEILIKKDKGFLPISRQSVSQAVNWEIENLLTHLDTVIKGSAYAGDLSKGLIMVGGGALLPGLMERIEERTHLAVGMGVATQGLKNPAIYASVIGLAQMHYLEHQQQRIHLASPATIKDRVVNAVRDLCQEYF